MTRPLPRIVVAVLERLVPRARRPEVLGDLAEDYDRAHVEMGGLRARLWLVYEVSSLAVAWLRYARGSVLRTLRLLLRDLQMAWRSLSRRPLASFGAAAMLAVGVVAVALSGALRHTLLARPVSAVHGHMVQRLVAVDTSGLEQTRFSALELARIQARTDGVALIAAVGLEPALLRAGVARRQTLAEVVSPHHANVIGMAMQRGRPLMAPDFQEGAAPAAVISDVLWRELFGRSDLATSGTLFVNGRPFSVVGIARAGAPTSFLGASVDLWVPLAQGDAFFSTGWRTNPALRSLSIFVLPDAPRPVLDDRLRQTTTTLAAEHPEPWRRRTLALTPATALLGTQRDSAIVLSRVLLTLSLLILVVACANLGAMMVAAAAAGRRAMAVHAAIGAGPGAAPRRLLIEGGLIGAGASSLAAVLYAWARTQVSDVALLPTLSLRLDLPLVSEVLGGLVPAGILSGVLMALGPAAWVARQAAGRGLQEHPRNTCDRGVARLRRVLVGAQMALCMVLLVGATLFTRSLDRLTNADLGIVRQGLIALDFDIEPAVTPSQAPATVAEEALRRTRAIPGVAAAAMASRAPVDASTPSMRVATPGDAGHEAVEVTFNTITSGYFETVGMPLASGRAFGEREAGAVAIVNETLARRLWPGGDALGRGLTIEAGARTVQVVGVARDATYRAIGEEGRPHLYLPTAPAFGHALLVRTTGDPRRMLRSVQDVLDATGPGVAGFFPRTADDHLAIQLLPTRAASIVATWLGTLALVFCAVGLYGLITWFARVRQAEMAIRLALGATRADVARLMVRQAFATAGPGILVGTVLAGGGVLAARGLLFGIGGVDVVAIGAGAVTLVVLVVAASWVPARRAARTDPASVLRMT